MIFVPSIGGVVLCIYIFANQRGNVIAPGDGNFNITWREFRRWLRLASSADVNARALNGRTPLMQLVRNSVVVIASISMTVYGMV